jgi:hypothetical protein
MTEFERDVETLRKACESLPRRDEYVGALDRLVATLRREQEAKQAAIERWRARTQVAPATASGASGGRKRRVNRSRRAA